MGINWRTIRRSVTLDRTEVMDIGRKSAFFFGVGNFWYRTDGGNVPLSGYSGGRYRKVDQIRRGLVNAGAPSLRNLMSVSLSQASIYRNF